MNCSISIVLITNLFSPLPLASLQLMSILIQIHDPLSLGKIRRDLFVAVPVEQPRLISQILIGCRVDLMGANLNIFNLSYLL